MDKTELIEYIESKNDGSHFSAELVLDEAQYSGLIKKYEVVHQENLGERRWGFDQETVCKINDDYYLSFITYVTTGDGGEDTLSGVEEVKPKEKTITVYVPVDN